MQSQIDCGNAAQLVGVQNKMLSLHLGSINCTLYFALLRRSNQNEMDMVSGTGLGQGTDYSDVYRISSSTLFCTELPHDYKFGL
jgi:hypothetical protein